MAIPLLRFFFRTANKNPACRILRLRRVALATLFHSAAVRSLAERFLCHRTKFPMTQKRAQNRPLRFCAPVELPERFPPLWEVAPSVVGRCRPAFSERRPKPVLLPGSFCVPLRHRLSDLSRFHRPINIILWQRKLIHLPRSYHLKCEVSRLNSWGPCVKKSDCNLQSGFSSIIPLSLPAAKL